MKIFLAAGAGKFNETQDPRDLLIDESHHQSLLSYAYRNTEKSWHTLWNSRQCDIIIDSGAFTVHTTNKVVSPHEYAEWALDFKSRWEKKSRSIFFMNLDVIGDQGKSWENQELLSKLGIETIPIITVGASKEDIERALSYEYFALGGLVGENNNKVRTWLDYCYGFIKNHFVETGVLPKTHLLGVTKEWAINRYPCYSCDSSSWIGCLRYGSGRAAGLPKVPFYTNSKVALNINIHVLRAEVRKYKLLQQNATNLWAGRGIKFED